MRKLKPKYQIGQRVIWNGEVDNGTMGKIVDITHFGRLIIQWYDNDSDETCAWEPSDEDFDKLEFLPPRKHGTMTRSTLIQLVRGAYNVGVDDGIKFGVGKHNDKDFNQWINALINAL